MKKVFCFLCVLLLATCVYAVKIYEKENEEIFMLKVLSDLADPAGVYNAKNISGSISSLSFLFDNDIEKSNGIYDNRHEPFRLEGSSGHVWYDFGEGNETVVDAIGITPTAYSWITNARAVNNFTIYGTSDNPASSTAEWVPLYSESNQQLNTLYANNNNYYPWNRYIYTFENTTAYRGYKVYMENVSDNLHVEVQELELFNSKKDFAEKIFVRGDKYDCGTVSTGFGVVSVEGLSSITISAEAGPIDGRIQVYGVPTGFNVYTINGEGSHVLKETHQGTSFDLVLDGTATEVEIVYDYQIANLDVFPLYISPSGNDSNDGFLPESAKRTLPTAVKYLDELFASDSISKAVVYVLPGTNSVENMTVLTNNISVVGLGEKPEDVVLHQKLNAGWNSPNRRLFHINHKDATVSNLTMYNGSVYGRGGAVFIGDNTDNDATIKYTAPDGQDGGMVTNCIIDSCRNSMRNTTSGGGSIYMSSSNAVVTHTIIKNSSNTGNPTWHSLPVSSAVYADNGARLSNCLIQNSSLTGGLGVNVTSSCCVFASSGAIVENCTVVGFEGVKGYGVYNRGDTTKVINTVIVDAFNTYITEDGTATNRVLSAAGGNLACFVKCATDSINKDAEINTPINESCYLSTPSEMFENYVDGDYTPSVESILLNRGTLDGITIPAIDIAGKERVKFDRIDIGCYESQKNLCTIIVIR